MPTPDELKAWGDALSTAKGYADAILLKPLNELGGILSDTVGYWRLKNQVRLMLKAKEWLEQKNIDPARLRPDIFVPLLEDGGNTEDEGLADMFAALLACHLDPNAQGLVHPSYTKVLSQMSPLDARMMIEYRKTASDKQYRDLGLCGTPLTVSFAAELVGISSDEAYLSCLNLNRLGIAHHLGFRPPSEHPWPEVFDLRGRKGDITDIRRRSKIRCPAANT